MQAPEIQAPVQMAKHDIKFKYNSRDKNMMGNIRRTINYMKEGA